MRRLRSYRGRAALVTGASSGLGKELALRLARTATGGTDVKKLREKRPRLVKAANDKKSTAARRDVADAVSARDVAENRLADVENALVLR